MPIMTVVISCISQDSGTALAYCLPHLYRIHTAHGNECLTRTLAFFLFLACESVCLPLACRCRDAPYFTGAATSSTCLTIDPIQVMSRWFGLGNDSCFAHPSGFRNIAKTTSM